MKKHLFMLVATIAISLFTTGCATMHMGWTAMTGQGKLDKGAMTAYDNMFTEVVKNGDPAKAMMKEFEVAEDVSGDDVKESITALTEEFNMRLTNYVKMFTLENAKDDEVKEARIYSLCSLPIAKKFLNHSRYFGGFMPCRIIYVEYGNGKKYLITMDLTLAIHGGYPLEPEMLKLAKQVEKAMTEIPARAAKGDF